MSRIVTVQGVDVSSIGLGTWQLRGGACVEAVRHALELGYRHIDTARAYHNEAQVAQGMADSGVPREEVFVTSKIPTSQVEPRTLRAAGEASLRALETDYLDLLLLHWPNPTIPLAAQLEALTSLREEGKARQIGVSNYPPDLLREALDLAPVFCDQVEYHPFLAQKALVRMAVEHDLLLTAYSPLAKGAVHDDPVLNEIGSAHGKTAAQVALRWLIDQPNVVAIPRSSRAENRRANLEVFDFALSDEQRRRIDALDRQRPLVSPPWA